MRKLLMAAMMIVTLLLIFEAAYGGEEGIGRAVERGAERAGPGIGSIDP
jgi:hypothetical protein